MSFRRDNKGAEARVRRKGEAVSVVSVRRRDPEKGVMWPGQQRQCSEQDTCEARPGGHWRWGGTGTSASLQKPRTGENALWVRALAAKA